MRTRALLCTLALPLFLVACGGGEDDAGTDQAAEPSPTAVGVNEEFLQADGTIQIRSKDPVFHGPTEVPSGSNTFTLFNDGNFPHELRLVALKEDDAPLHEITNLPAEKVLEEVTEIDAIASVKPGETSTDKIEVDLESGRYGFICLLKDTYSQSTHAQFGMALEFTAT